MIELLLLKLGVPQTLVKLVTTLAIIAAGIAVYYYVTNLQERLETTRVDLVEVSKNLEDYQTNTRKVFEEMTITAEEINRIRAEMDDKNEVFSKHDFGKLFKAKSGLMLNRINAGTIRVFREFESESGKDSLSKTP